MTILRTNWISCCLYWILLFVLNVFSYNLDTEFPIIFNGLQSDDYFGFSVGLLQNINGYTALITAPRANSSEVQGLHQPGVLYNCNISFSGDTLPCQEVVVDTKGNQIKRNLNNQDLSYQDKQDDMWLGASLDVQPSEDSNVVVCGHLWKNQYIKKTTYTVNGVCYVINKDLDVTQVAKLVPFVDRGKQITGSGNTAQNFYAFAQAGSSVAFSKDGQYLLLGSPGFHEGTGNIVSYKLDPGNDMAGLKNPVIPIIPVGHRRSFYGYSGYSITSGRFFSGNVTYSAVGAPRDGNYYGKVFIFMPVDKSSGKLVANETKQGGQFGEYFGASVSGIDLNGDGLTDLLVGAPFYSEETGGDEGKVYVYISNGEELEFLAVLLGQKKPDARFGTCIADTGDLNQDGFNDVAIGAPYEDERGAVYIYHGTKEGLNKKYAQRIGAEDIRTSQRISGFGISISRGLDTDDNSYLDLLVGSYSSSAAVLLRTRPVIQTASDLLFELHDINRNITKCTVEGEWLTCFNVTYCLQYSGEHVPSSLVFKTELTMDSNYNSARRGFLFSNGERQTSVSRNMKVDAGTSNTCIQETAYIHGNIKDEFTPVQFLLSYDLDFDLMHVGWNKSFCKNCPVINPSSSTNVSKSIPFVLDCGLDDKCSSDLIVEAHVLGNPSGKPLIIGQNDTLTLHVTIRNSGETAYAPVLFINLSSEVSVVKADLCLLEEDVNTTLRCAFDKPFKAGKTNIIQIKIDSKRIPVNTTSLNFLFEVTTGSEELNYSDNKFNLPVFFRTAADISITGFTEDEQIPFKEDKNTSSLVVHKYYVKNYGPSPVDRIDIYLYVPTTLDGKNGLVNFLTFTDFKADDSETAIIPEKCSSSFVKINLNSNPRKKSESYVSRENVLDEETTTQVSGISNSTESHVVGKRNVGNTSASGTRGGGYHIVDCETATCEKIHCIAGPFLDYQKFTKIILSAHLNLTALSSAMESWNRIEFITKGHIFMTGAKMEPEKYPDEVKVKTVIVRPGPALSRDVEKWIIFVSVGCGILLLLIILFVLIKIGFFKRQQKEEMEKMTFQADLKELVVKEEEDKEPTENNPLNATPTTDADT